MAETDTVHPALLTPPAPPEPVSVVDVAEYILTSAAADGQPEMETSRLQSLVYLSQGWHLAMTGLPLFREPIEAWAEGPVVPALHALHAGETVVRAGFFYAKRTAPPDPAEVLARAQAGWDSWYDAEPVPGEEDSLSHDYVREVVPDLIQALQLTRAELAVERAKNAAPDTASD